MKEQLISFETSVLADKAGFPHTDCRVWVTDLDGSKAIWKSSNSATVKPAPTQSLLQKWLREVHNYHIEIHQIPIHPTYNFSIIWIFNGVQSKTGNGYKSYEEALEVGLLESLKLIN